MEDTIQAGESLAIISTRVNRTPVGRSASNRPVHGNLDDFRVEGIKSTQLVIAPTLSIDYHMPGIIHQVA